MVQTASEKIADALTRHRQRVIQLENGIIAGIVAKFQVDRQALLDELVGLTDKSQLSEQDLRAYVQRVKGKLAVLADEMKKNLRQNMRGLVQVEAATLRRILGNSIPQAAIEAATAIDPQRVSLDPRVQVPDATVSAVVEKPIKGVDLDAAVDRGVQRIWMGVEAQVMGAHGQAVHKGLASTLAGGEAPVIGMEVPGLLAGGLGLVRQILKDGASAMVRALVQTRVNSVVNDAATHVYRANIGLLAGEMFSATLDLRTCSVCAQLDGTQYYYGSAPAGGQREVSKPMLPVHSGCRCHYIPVLKSVESLGIDDPQVVVQMGGEPKTMTYEEWFMQQSAGEQRDILGPGRYEAWKARRLKLADLVDLESLMPLTLAQLGEG